MTRVAWGLSPTAVTGRIHSNIGMDTTDYGNVPASRKAQFSMPSVLSLVVALASFATERPLWALVLSIAAAVFGVIGVVVALLPGVRGGLLSMLSILMGLVGLIVAIIRLIA